VWWCGWGCVGIVVGVFLMTTSSSMAVLGVLGFGDDEINRILDYLYPALASEIQQSNKTLMQG